MGSRTGRNKKRVREDILEWLPFPVLGEIKYGCKFPYGKKLEMGTGRYWERMWFPVLEEIQYRYGFPYSSHGQFKMVTVLAQIYAWL